MYRCLRTCSARALAGAHGLSLIHSPSLCARGIEVFIDLVLQCDALVNAEVGTILVNVDDLWLQSMVPEESFNGPPAVDDAPVIYYEAALR